VAAVVGPRPVAAAPAGLQRAAGAGDEPPAVAAAPAAPRPGAATAVERLVVVAVAALGPAAEAVAG